MCAECDFLSDKAGRDRNAQHDQDRMRENNKVKTLDLQASEQAGEADALSCRNETGNVVVVVNSIATLLFELASLATAVVTDRFGSVQGGSACGSDLVAITGHLIRNRKFSRALSIAVLNRSRQ